MVNVAVQVFDPEIPLASGAFYVLEVVCGILDATFVYIAQPFWNLVHISVVDQLIEFLWTKFRHSYVEFRDFLEIIFNALFVGFISHSVFSSFLPPRCWTVTGIAWTSSSLS